MVRAVPERATVPIEHTWDVESIFPTVDAWEQAYVRAEAGLASLDRFHGSLHTGPDVLADWFETFDVLYREIGSIVIYGSMVHAVDTGDPVAKALQDRGLALFARGVAATAFAEPEMLEIGFETLRRWAHGSDQLRVYEHYLDELERRQQHIRSAEVEELLGYVQDPFQAAEETHGILADADLRVAPAQDSQEESVEVAQGNYHALLASADRELRRTAWEHYADAHLALKNTMASCISTGVKHHVFMARARHYDSSLEAALVPSHVPTSVFHNLIDTFKRNLPTWHRYWEVRRRALGYDQLHVYDIWAPLTVDEPTISFEQAMQWISEGMTPLGASYVDVLRRGALEDRWVDIYPNQRKSSGAFSTGWPGTKPFILMSYDDDIFSLSTLAHELGHSMHSHLAWETQPMIYSYYGIFLAEVASNFNQALVRSHLMQVNQDPTFQIVLIEEAMSNFHRYFFIMPTLARFELEIHERVERGEALTADSMIALLTSLFREGYGDEVVVDDERVGITWAEFSTHMYGNFYVWQYATGIAAANALANGVVEGGEEAAERYLAFLRSGSSLYPLDALQMAGVDLSSPEPVDAAFKVLADMVERLAGLVDEREAAAV
jgi:oligoendopeptidase F